MRRLVFLVAALALLAASLSTTAAMGASTSSVKVGVYDNYFTKFSSTKKCGFNLNDPSKAKLCNSLTSGRKVIWTWKGVDFHNVTLVSAPSRINESDYSKFSSNTVVEGKFARRLKRTGIYLFVCTIHPEMQQKLKVKSAS